MNYRHTVKTIEKPCKKHISVTKVVKVVKVSCQCDKRGHDLTCERQAPAFYTGSSRSRINDR